MNTEIKRFTKAEDVAEAYDAAQYEHCISSAGCYNSAVATAQFLGGVETYNSNDVNRTRSFAPTRIFKFDDLSSVEVTYEGAFVILPNEPY